MRDPRDEGTCTLRGAAPAVAIALVLALAGPAGAVTIEQWGAEAGLGGWTQDFEYEGETLYDPSQLLPGFTAGAYVDLGAGVVAPRIELLYQARGSKDESPRFEQGEEVGISTTEYRGHYLSIPVTAKMQKVGVDTTPYLAIGLGLEILLGSSSDSAEIHDNLDPVSLGLHVMTGLEFSKLGLQIRFYRDLTNPYSPPADDPLKSVKNQGFALMLTMKLGPGPE